MKDQFLKQTSWAKKQTHTKKEKVIRDEMKSHQINSCWFLSKFSILRARGPASFLFYFIEPLTVELYTTDGI